MTEKRIRVNAKETAKGFWQLDITIEVTGDDITADDVDILKVIQAKEKEFRENNRKLVGDEFVS